jgi:hypothetical protein
MDTASLLLIVEHTAAELSAILGLCFVVGIILSYLERETERVYMRVFGWRAMLWTGWIGTPVHEISHIFFAKLFRHRLTDVSLFHPDPQTGRLGHVSHSYNPRSLYQQIGNFFIGAAPLIGGSIALLLLFYGLVPHASELFETLRHAEATTALTQTLMRIISVQNFTSPQFWIFIYTSICIVSHIAPSSADVRGMWVGLIWFILLFIAVHSMAALFGFDLSNRIAGSLYGGIIGGLFAYSLLVSFVHFLLVRVFLAPFARHRL